MAAKAPVCKIHGRALICPACIGRKGGKKRSTAKARANRKNAALPRPRE